MYRQDIHNKPAHKHDCEGCVFVGGLHYEHRRWVAPGTPNEEPMQEIIFLAYDVYVCGHQGNIVVRWGSEGQEYDSGTEWVLGKEGSEPDFRSRRNNRRSAVDVWTSEFPAYAWSRDEVAATVLAHHAVKQFAGSWTPEKGLETYAESADGDGKTYNTVIRMTLTEVWNERYPHSGE